MPRPLKTELPLPEPQEMLGLKIAQFRKSRGLTQVQLAERIGITRSILGRYETGRITLSCAILARFSLVLEVPADELLGISPAENSEPKLSLRLIKRLQEIEKLPEAKKKAILKTLDDLIRANS